MKKKINVLLFIFLTTYGCVGQNINNTLPTPTNSLKPSSIVSASPTASVVASVTPTPSSTPTVVVTPNPIITPTPSLAPTQSPLPIQMKNLSFGINNPFIKITSKELEDYQKESLEVNSDLNAINADSFILDLNQDLVDFESTKEGFLWTVYDNILEKYKDKPTSIYFRLNYRNLLGSTSITQRARFIEFIAKATERYKDYNISWIIGDKINDLNSINATPKEFVDFLTLCVNNIKVFSPNAKMFLGSLVQSELFAKNNYYTVDNLLSYINLGAGKICDGFIFEIYSLDVNNVDQASSSIFRNTNYQLISKYYQVINDVLQTKGLSNKKLYLISSTFGGETVDQASQTEQDQANDLFRRIIYSVSTGFDKFFVSQLYDRETSEPISFYKRLGIEVKDSTGERKKIAYWMYKFISSKLSNTKFTGFINGLPINIKGFTFESDTKRYYVLWNENKNYNDNIQIDIGTNAGISYTAPNDISTLGTSNEFIVFDNSKKANVSFNSYSLSPRIIEVNK